MTDANPGAFGPCVSLHKPNLTSKHKQANCQHAKAPAACLEINTLELQPTSMSILVKALQNPTGTRCQPSLQQGSDKILDVQIEQLVQLCLRAYDNGNWTRVKSVPG